MNRMTLAGRLGKDPEVRFTSSGKKVTTIRLAVNQRRSGKEDTMWWRVTIWGERFDKMMPYLKKGSALVVIGEMTKPQIYTDRDGNPQVSLDITAIDIAFSPFGRMTDSNGEETSQIGAGFSTETTGKGGEGIGKVEKEIEEETPFSEEEIPF